jgi:hypothetical protein
MANPTIFKTGQTKWTNRHDTFTKPIQDLYDLWNADTSDIVADYNSMTAAIQRLIGCAVKAKTRLRALGGAWSFTEIATTDGIMLNTKPMNMVFTISAASVPEYSGNAKDLLFAQCGNSVLELNNYLGRRQRSLKTTGASNGQTIVGAMSTGTHGSAIDVGAVQDYIVGLHIITSDQKSVWLERNSYPVVSEAFAHRLQAERVRDDALFNAALVSFGSFGFIHGVMLESTDIFLLECFCERRALDPSILRIMNTLDFTNAPLPYGSERPHHFRVMMNPYDKDGFVFIYTMYKRPYRTNYTPPRPEAGKIGPGDDAPAFIGLLTDVVPALVPTVVNNLIGTTLKPFQGKWGTHAEIFSNTDLRGKVISAAIGVDLRDVLRVKDIIVGLNNQARFPGLFAFRFVKGTMATLGFTRFAHTCVIEMDGVESDRSRKFIKSIWDALEAQRIEYTVHWGKICEINGNRLQAMYGQRVDAWREARSRLLSDEMKKVSTNTIMEEWGLA